MFSTLINFCFFVLAVSLPLEERQLGPTVTIKNGTVVGSTLLGIDSFKGIPFAQPPVKQLRLRPPQSIDSSFGTIVATGTPRACPQFFTQANTTSLPAGALGLFLDTPLAQEATNAGEDCLTLNVQRPANVSSSSKLPVVFWMYVPEWSFTQP